MGNLNSTLSRTESRDKLGDRDSNRNNGESAELVGRSFFNKDLSMSRTNLLTNIGLQTINEVDDNFMAQKEADSSKRERISKHLSQVSKNEEERLSEAKLKLYSKLHSRYSQDPESLIRFNNSANEKMLAHVIEQDCIVNNYIEELNSWPKNLEYVPANPSKEASSKSKETIKAILPSLETQDPGDRIKYWDASDHRIDKKLTRAKTMSSAKFAIL
jgi:hypothetical protein